MWRWIILGGVLAACQPEVEVDPLTVFRYNEASGITSLDPAFARSQSNIWAVNQLFDGLVAFDSILQVVPALATHWAMSPDGLEYIFYLRKGVQFHPHAVFGHQPRFLKAADVVYSFTRLANPRLNAPGAWVVKDIRAVKAQGDTAVVFVLQRPLPALLSLLAMPYSLVVPAQADSIPDFAAHPTGTGPFYLKVWEDQEKLVMRKNPHYFQPGLPKLEAVSIRFVPEKQAAFLDLLTGHLDFVSGLDGSFKDEVFAPNGTLKPEYARQLRLQTGMYLNTEYLGILNTANGEALTDARIRRALNMGFDRALMLQTLRNNLGVPAQFGLIPPALPGAYTQEPLVYNPEAAKQLIRAAGWDGRLKVTLLTNPSYLDLCEFIQASWKQIGVETTLEVVPPSTLRQQMATGKAPFFRASWIADFPDASNYLSLFYGPLAAPQGPNYTQFKNPLFDQWFKEAEASVGEEERLVLYRKMDSLVQAEAPVIPLFYDQVVRLVQPNVRGLSTNPLNLLDLRRVWKEAPVKP
jgi:peptide/nickel transport system substrate-binding protein